MLSSRGAMLAAVVASLLVLEGAAYVLPRFSSKKHCVRGLSFLGAVTSDTHSAEWPEPQVGDIVAFAGEWPGESLVGQIESLQKVSMPRKRWIADVVALEDQAKELWRAPSSSRARRRRNAIDVAELVPLSAEYVLDSDAWRVGREGAAAKELSGSAVGLERRADGYRDLPEDFRPQQEPIDVDKARRASRNYKTIKRDLFSDSAIITGVGLVAALVIGGPSDAAPFAIGASASLAYLTLLARAADNAGKPNDLSSAARFAPLILAFASLAAYHGVVDSPRPQMLSLIPQREFAAALIGVLAYRLPLVWRHVISELTPDELLEMTPGSVGAAKRITKDMIKTTDEDDDVVYYSPSQTIVVVSGPPGAGKSILVQRLLAEDDRFVSPSWVPPPERDVDPLQLGAEEEEFAVILDSWTDVLNERPAQALRRSELVERADGRVAVVDCDVDIARQLAMVDGARLLGVWVSVDSLDALEDRLLLAESETAVRDKGMTPGSETTTYVNDRVRLRLSTVIEDLDFGVRSPMFDFTIINNADVDPAYAKLKRASGFVFADEY